MNNIDKGLFDALTAANLSGITGIFDKVAPPTQGYPFVVFQEQSNLDDYTFTARAWNDTVYQVKAITKADSKVSAGLLQAAIDAALTDNEFVLPGGTVMYCRRISSFSYPEVQHGERFNHAGGLFRIWARP